MRVIRTESTTTDMPGLKFVPGLVAALSGLCALAAALDPFFEPSLVLASTPWLMIAACAGLWLGWAGTLAMREEQSTLGRALLLAGNGIPGVLLSLPLIAVLTSMVTPVPEFIVALLVGVPLALVAILAGGLARFAGEYTRIVEIDPERQEVRKSARLVFTGDQDLTHSFDDFDRIEVERQGKDFPIWKVTVAGNERVLVESADRTQALSLARRIAAVADWPIVES